MQFALAAALAAFLAVHHVDALKAHFYGLPGYNQKHSISTTYNLLDTVYPVFCFNKMIDMNDLNANMNHKWIIQLDGHFMKKLTAADVDFIPLREAIRDKKVKISEKILEKRRKGESGVTYLSPNENYYFRPWYYLFLVKSYYSPTDLKVREKKSGKKHVKAYCWTAPINLSQWDISTGKYWWVLYKRQYVVNSRFGSLRWWGKKFKSKKFKISAASKDATDAKNNRLQENYANVHQPLLQQSSQYVNLPVQASEETEGNRVLV